MTTIQWLYLISPHQFRIGAADVVRIDLGGILRESGGESPAAILAMAPASSLGVSVITSAPSGNVLLPVFELHHDLGSHQPQIGIVDRAENIAAPRVDHRRPQRARTE